MKGSCLCGQVKFSFKTIVAAPSHCHCSMCRKFHGAAMGSYCVVRRDDFSWDSGGELVKYFQSSDQVQRGFCSHCGSSLTFENSSEAEYIDIALGTLDQQIELLPDTHIYVNDSVNWLTLDDELDKYTLGRNSEKCPTSHS